MYLVNGILSESIIQLKVETVIILKCIFVIQGAARSMMDGIGDDGLVVDGRKLFFEYRWMPFI